MSNRSWEKRNNEKSEVTMQRQTGPWIGMLVGPREMRQGFGLAEVSATDYHHIPFGPLLSLKDVQTGETAEALPCDVRVIVVRPNNKDGIKWGRMVVGPGQSLAKDNIGIVCGFYFDGTPQNRVARVLVKNVVSGAKSTVDPADLYLAYPA